ncbi:MAG TPA: pyridoxal 5'-phosphate synthase glutaminase subunit PdxT, partial [Candidatus Magasanikbacteria bacterium]|nr:pyridoxal 5'-phosphate synthase glutaminase subunit PdxT [Candidatus Magasanikbacteria bacterium]
MLKIGVLDIQGSVEEHFLVLENLSKKYNFVPVLVKTVDDFNNLNGLILPGGESTTIGKLLKLYKLDKEI